jgi:hypothetical protein
MGPRNRFQGMNSASPCSLAGRYDNPIPSPHRLFKNSSSEDDSTAIPTIGGVANSPVSTKCGIVDSLYQRYTELATPPSLIGGKSIFDYEHLPEFESKIEKATAIVQGTFGEPFWLVGFLDLEPYFCIIILVQIRK